MEELDVFVFDGDDTLWHSEELYDEALAEAAELVESAGLPGDEWRETQRGIDLQNVRILGLSPQRFPLSSRQATEILYRRNGLEPDPNVIAGVTRASRSVFSRRARLIEGAPDVLRRLGNRHRLALLTKGDPEVQRRRIADSGLRADFEIVKIVANKSSESFMQVLRSLGTSPARACSVGNSIPSDILPALEAGMWAVWIDAHVWEHEHHNTEIYHPRFRVVESLQDLPVLLSGPASRP